MPARSGVVAEAAVTVLAARLSVEVPGLEEAEIQRIAHRQAADLTLTGFRVTVPVAALPATLRRRRRPTSST